MIPLKHDHFQTTKNSNKLIKENKNLCEHTTHTSQCDDLIMISQTTFLPICYIRLCSVTCSSLSMPQGLSFPESCWNCPTRVGWLPSLQGLCPRQSHSWPWFQLGATSTKTQRGHFSFSYVQNVLRTRSFSGLWDSTQYEKIIWSFRRKSDLKAALFLSKITMNYESHWLEAGETTGFCGESKTMERSQHRWDRCVTRGLCRASSPACILWGLVLEV